MQTLQSYTERNTSFVVQKSVVIQVYGACISSGIGILEACRVTGTSMGFSEQVVRRSMLISLAKWILSFLMKHCPGQSLCKWPAKSDHTRCGIQAEADA